MNNKKSEANHLQSNARKGFLAKHWLTILAVLYLVSPIDLLPEALLPVVGQSDDLLVAIFEIVKLWMDHKKSGTPK